MIFSTLKVLKGKLLFIQINKACIMNINVLDSVNTLFNSRLKATLINGENVIITRTYIPAKVESRMVVKFNSASRCLPS
ncbi:LytTR family transcriptional regulator DNA-binding domain-containing protein [Clostridium estertheticum]|uniref:LytTR family transcriptional regulator DNA-binding domain-containing protein n=1 Tax=Clostridium estertheticum TaxID=238834 RepID=UPI00227B6706|nr:LytTR family transcriptional regulator DNA-binding domain-containing protein [Clostridium estertheticum]WAG63466.1 LytTR family transcriptional regulator DNA-binding domain-containing protein [Clostridium estertheticum]